ncbi:FemAB family XrtA/PEP-CTERM system-associated protein [Thiovibrio sp. JS02]
MVEIKTISAGHSPAWEQYVQENPHAGPYLSLAWKEAVENGYGHTAYYLAAFQHGRIKGVLPLFLIKPPLPGCGGSLVSLPFCDYGGLFADDGEGAAALVERALSLAGELGAGLEIRSSSPVPVVAEDDRFGQATDKCRMLMELPSSSALLWDGFKSKLRSQVKRAGKDGLLCRTGHAELLPDFYSVFSQNMRDLGSPVHSKKWLHSLLGAYGGRARAAVVYKDDIAVAGGIVLAHGKLLTIPWASALREYNRLSPNMLLYWTFLEYACDNGFEFFDFGRSTPNEGTYAFKKQWGARPAPLHWYRQGFPRGGVEKAGTARRLLEQVWRRLPLAAANFMGPSVRKYIDR